MNADARNEKGRASEPCQAWQPLLTLLAAGGELDADEHARINRHLTQCPACSASLEREKALLALVADSQHEPDAALLEASRAGLEEALDREEERGWLRRKLAVLLPSSWISPSPAWSGALLLLIGFTVGLLGPRLLLRSHATPVSGSGSAAAPNASATGATPMPEVNARPNAISPSPAPIDLRAADVAGINVFRSGDSGSPRVELRLRTQQPVTVRGTLDDDDVRNVLVNILQDNRFCPDPDLRLDAVNLLRARHNDLAVRSVLCHAARTDQDAAVRRMALEALAGADPQAMIRDTLLDALAADDDPGVRIQAINVLRDMAGRSQMLPDDRVLSVLRDRTQKDPSALVRVQSAAALRALAPPPVP